MSDEFDPYLQWLGIGPHERPVDHYRLLGIARFEADSHTIATAADQRMMYVRTFQTGPRGAQTQSLLNDLATARVCLLNPLTKSTYDDFLRGRVAAESAGGSGAPVAGRFASYPIAPPPAPPPVAASIHPAPPRQQAAPPPPLAIRVNQSTPAEHQAFHADSPQPFAARPWFPVLVISAVVAVAVAVWGIGRWRRTAVVPDAAADKFVQTTANEGGESASEHAQGSSNAAATDDYPSDVFVAQEGTGEVNFPATVAKLLGPALSLDTSGTESTITGWTGDDDVVTWEFRIVRPDIFRVEITYAATEDAAGGKFAISVGDAEKSGDIVSTGGAGTFRTDRFFLPVKRKGKHTLTVRTVERKGQQLWTLKSVRFESPGITSKEGKTR